MTRTASVPRDSLFNSQWHLLNTGQNGGVAGIDANVLGAWELATGAGVRIGIIDDGFERTHSDLAGRFSTTLGYDAIGRDTSPDAAAAEFHGTAVAGVLGAAANGTGVVGVAYGAELVGYRVAYGSAGTVEMFANQLRLAAETDVVNNSWGYTNAFSDDFASSSFRPLEQALEYGVANGREGLGTNYVFASGNSRQRGDNVNHHNLQNAIEVITVGAVDSSGKVANFSTPGAAILVSAGGVGVVTADRTGSNGYGSGDTVAVSGTSFAAPIVSGVVALMLEANENLGWRDVQEILAYTARPVDPAGAWVTNRAGNANGGGLQFSNDYGFGLVDAAAAVRLAETWSLQSTSANMVSASASATPNAMVESYMSANSTVSIGSNIRLDKVEVTVALDHTWMGDVRIILVSPSGTQSVLIDRPGVAPGTSGAGWSTDDIRFTLSSNAFWGESSVGNWTLRVQDVAAADGGTLESWTLRVHGDTVTANDLYVYTNGYVSLASTQNARSTLRDTNGGNDTLNASAVTFDTVLDLLTGNGRIGTAALNIASGSVIENAFGGTGADLIIGNAAANRLDGGQGADTLRGGAGSDSLLGGDGDDWLEGGDGFDLAFFDGLFASFSIVAESGGWWISQALGLAGRDWITGIERLVFDDRSFDLIGTPTRLTNDTVSTAEDVPITISVLANDVGIGLQLVSATGARNGQTQVMPDGTIRYTPNADWFGNDTITYVVRDSAGQLTTGTVSVTVTAVNDAPVAVADRLSVIAGSTTALNLTANDTDVDGGTPMLVRATSAAGATLTINADGTLAYATKPGFLGRDVVTYTIRDAGGLEAQGTAEVLVGAPALVTRDDTARGAEDSALTIDVLGNDIGLGLQLLSASGATHGTLSVQADGRVLYRPNADWSGTDSFTYTARDSAGVTSQGRVNVTIDAVADAPIARPDSLTAGAGVTARLAVMANDTDADGPGLKLISARSESGALVSLRADGTLDYLAASSFAGRDQVTYTIEDPTGLRATAIATIAVAASQAATLGFSNGLSSITPLSVSASLNGTYTAEQLGIVGAPAGSRVAIQRGQGSTEITLLDAWNSVKNVAVNDADGGSVVTRNFVDTAITLGGDAGSRVTVADAKRGFIATGQGDDIVTVTARGGDATAAFNTFNIQTGAGNDQVQVTGSGNFTVVVFDGGAGNDSITLSGTGASSLAGGTGNDTLRGGAGADTLTGGQGQDVMTGGAGRDVFVFNRGDGQDQITDFDAAGVDRLHLVGFTAGEVTWSSVSGGVLVRLGDGGDAVMLQNLLASAFDSTDLIWG